MLSFLLRIWKTFAWLWKFKKSLHCEAEMLGLNWFRFGSVVYRNKVNEFDSVESVRIVCLVMKLKRSSRWFRSGNGSVIPIDMLLSLQKWFIYWFRSRNKVREFDSVGNLKNVCLVIGLERSSHCLGSGNGSIIKIDLLTCLCENDLFIYIFTCWFG